MQLDFIKASCGIVYMGPTPERGGTDLILRPQTVHKTQKPSLFHVVMYNDDYTPMNYVVDLLQRYFGKNEGDAKNVMMEIHTKGKGIAGTYQLDVANTKANEAAADARKNDHPFMIKLEKA